MDDRKGHVILIPLPAQSHLKCMLKLAKLLHHKGLRVTFLNTVSNHNRLLESGGVHSAPGFEFKTMPDGSSDDTAPQDLHEVCEFLGRNFFDFFQDFVRTLETPLTCIISDGLMTFANTIGAAEKLGIPIMLQWTFAASGFMGFYHVKTLVDKGLVPLKDKSYLTNGYMDTEINWIPGMKGIRLKDFPEYVRTTDPNDPTLKVICEVVPTTHKVSKVIIHTFDELENSLVKELKSMFLHVYTIGPLQLLLNKMEENEETKSLNSSGYSLWKEELKCVQWLQSKKPNSVLYVNFGSCTLMSLQDLVEFGWGLANSNHYFLLIIRPNLVVENSIVWPLEIQDAIEKRGFIASWCAQEEVLNHPSIGGFLTHGGWGSIIESLSAGVPMICWPYNADQWINCRQICDEWEVGMKIDSNVKRGQVEKLTRELLEEDKGKIMKNKAMEWKNMAEIAVGPNGSSSLNIENLVNEISAFSRD